MYAVLINLCAPDRRCVLNWVLAGLALKIPFIVAGATAHGSQLAAALVMGADGVEIGTGFMATQECNIKQGIKVFCAECCAA